MKLAVSQAKVTAKRQRVSHTVSEILFSFIRQAKEGNQVNRIQAILGQERRSCGLSIRKLRGRRWGHTNSW